MAQLGLFTNHPNHNSLHKDITAIKTTRFNKNIPSNESKKNHFQCTYFRPQCPKNSSNRNFISHNQTLSDCSYDIKHEPDNASNVLRWLRSLPSNFMINDLEQNMNYCKLSEKTGHLYRYDGNRSKSLGSSLKSVDGIPFKEKGIMLVGNKQKVNFIDKLNSTSSSNTKKKLTNKKRNKNSSVSRLSKKCAKSDLSTDAKKSEENSTNNNQCQGILKDTSVNSVTSTSQKNTIEKQIASNKRLLHSIKEIINTVDNDNCVNRVETDNTDNKIEKNEKTVLMPSNIEVSENSTKKPFLKNPAIEKRLDNAMRNTLKRYMRSNTWDDFQGNNKNINEEPPVKKKKRVIPSLAPVNSFHMDLGYNWNTNSMLNNISHF